MDRARYGIAICLLLSISAQADVIELRAEDLPRLVSERNQSARGSLISVEAAEKRTGHLARSYLPSLSLDLGGETFNTGPYSTLTQPYGSVEARINLFRGGKDLLESRSRYAQVNEAAAQARKSQASVLTEARRAYWELVYERELISVLEEARKENDRHLAAANRRIQRGLTTATDRLDFEIHRSQVAEEIESMTHATVLTQIKLRALLAFSEETEIKSLSIIPHVHDETFLTFKLKSESHYEVASLRASEEQSRNESAQWNRWWTPTLDAYGGYYLYTTRDRDYLDQSRRSDTAAGVRMNLHLFDGLQSRNSASAAEIKAEALRNQAEQQERDIQGALKIAKEDMKHEHELTHEAEKRVEQGKSYLASTLAEYDRGVKNSPDVLGASQRLLTFRRRSAEIRRNYQWARAELLAVIGQ